MIHTIVPRRSNALIMEYARSGSLYTLIQELEAKTLTINQHQVDIIAWQMISGLTLINKLGYQHKRMSPWNVLLFFFDDEFPQIKLTDYWGGEDVTPFRANLTPEQVLFMELPEFCDKDNLQLYTTELRKDTPKYLRKIDVWQTGLIICALQRFVPNPEETTKLMPDGMTSLALMEHLEEEIVKRAKDKTQPEIMKLLSHMMRLEHKHRWEAEKLLQFAEKHGIDHPELAETGTSSELSDAPASTPQNDSEVARDDRSSNETEDERRKRDKRPRRNTAVPEEITTQHKTTAGQASRSTTSPLAQTKKGIARRVKRNSLTSTAGVRRGSGTFSLPPGLADDEESD